MKCKLGWLGLGVCVVGGVGAGLLLLTGCAVRNPPATVAHVDLERYQGIWYEVARYPNWFQRRCVGEVTAEYQLQEDGLVSVTNRCKNAGGEMEEATATARAVPGTGNARLKVRFAGPIAGDYWILGLDEKEYSWAVIGHPSRRFLWFLSRTPTVHPSTWKAMRTVAVEAGYDLERLERTGHTTP